jgi:hypothetical protein
MNAVAGTTDSPEMNMTQHRSTRAVALVFLALWCGACGEAAAPTPAVAAAVAPLPESYYAAVEPAAAKPVGAVKTAAKTGDAVVVVGRVGGERKVFSERRASFLLVDPELKACGEHGFDDPCKYPWDYCCEDKAKLRAGMVTVEFRGANGVLAAAVRGFHGLDHLKTVVVSGRAEKDDAGNVVVVADSVHVRP